MLQKLIQFGLYLIVIAIPITFKVRLLKGSDSIFQTKVPFVDILIIILFLLWVIKLLVSKTFREVKCVPRPFWAFLAFAVLSAFFAHNMKDSAKDLIQIIDYYFLCYILFINNVASLKHLLRIITLLVIVTIVVTVYGLYQRLLLGSDSYLLSSVFDDRHVLAGFFAVLLPVHLGLYFIHPSKVLKISIWTLVLGSLLIVTSIPAYVILFITFFGMMIYAKKPLLLAAVTAVFIIALALPLGIQMKDFNNLNRSFYEPEGIDNYHMCIRKSVEMTYTPEIGTLSLGKYKLKISSSLATVKSVPDKFTQPLIAARSKNELFSSGHVNQRILEWQAALSLIGAKPLLGVGIGNYQNEIGYYYQSFPKLNTMEPDTQNGYLIIASTMGLAGFGAFLWILLHFWKILRAMLRNRRDPIHGYLSLGFTGSLIAFSLYNFFCPLVNQTVIAPFILVLAFTRILRDINSTETFENGRIRELDDKAKA